MSRSLLCILILFSSLQFFCQKNDPKKNDTAKVSIHNMGKKINTPFADYAPVISADALMMVFTSRYPSTERELDKGLEGMENIYLTTYDEKKKVWREGAMYGATLNEPGRHNSAIALSADGQKMLLYRDDVNGNGDIYESTLNGKKWSKPVKLPEPINSADHESSASISQDGNTIYFVSERKGGMGGRDIWVCIKQNGKWGEPENLGPTVNTSLDEDGTFLHPDGKTLFFSSKGHNTLGGFDIFKTVLSEGKWSKPENIGAPINTPADELHFVLSASGTKGYYASAKPGGAGGKDIYEVRYTKLKTKKETPQLTILKGVITDELTDSVIEADMEIIDIEKNVVVATLNSNKATGKYLISLPSGKNYGVIVKAKDYLFHSVNVNIPFTTGYQEIVKDIELKKVVIGKSIVLNNIFYDFDKATLRSESMAELDRLINLLNENPTIKIELSSHTDDKGSDDYNQKLSQQRAQSVVDYLIQKGISTDRLTAKGYGETVPVAPNDTDENRQLNRRTEFKILSVN
jgi:outer membrane protein OmpA-like peptidoglycan-associated protein